MANAAGLLPFFILLSFTRATSIWTPHPPYGPAPPRDQAPPISRNAIQDPALLKYQVIGIVCGFLGWELIVATLLFTVGKRFRKSAQSSHGTLSMEMVKPNRWMADVSPVAQSASPSAKWGVFKSAGSSVKSSPITPSEAQFDTRVIQSDKERREKEMERIYETIFAQDTKAPREVSIKEQEVGGNGHVRNWSSSSRSFSQRRPPQLVNQHTESAGATQPTSPAQVVYPRHGSMPSDLAEPVYSTGDYIPNTTHAPSSPQSTHTHSRQASDSSLGSQNTAAGPYTSRAKHTRKFRNLTISSPIQKYPGNDDDDEEARTPLTPRHYNPGLPPLAPHQQLPRPITPIQDIEDDTDVAEDHSDMDPRRPLPPAAPQRNAPHLTVNTATQQRTVPPPLPPPPRDHRPPAMAASPSGSTNSLPFRSNPNLAHGPLGSQPISPGPTKTTLLSPRRDRFPKRQEQHPLGFVGLTSPGPQTAGMSPTTPYSPYMPFSPVTPVTPRLTTKAERKQRHREEGRRVANAEEDGVRDEKEIWGDSY